MVGFRTLGIMQQVVVPGVNKFYACGGTVVGQVSSPQVKGEWREKIDPQVVDFGFYNNDCHDCHEYEFLALAPAWLPGVQGRLPQEVEESGPCAPLYATVWRSAGRRV
jgi:hypothetical protein